MSQQLFGTPRIILWVAMFVLVGGGALLIFTKAASPYVSVESENAALSTGASVANDATASAGKAVQFKSQPVQSGWWQPSTMSLPWQWEISHPLVTTNAGDMGTNGSLYSGGAAPTPAVYDIDGFDNTTDTVNSLHTLGKKVICYIEVGAAESGRSDYAQFPGVALGKTMPGYPSEKYIDINNAQVLTIIKARVAMCHTKGFDAIEPDIDDSFAFASETGFSMSEQQEVTYLTTLSDYAHSLGMAWGLKNGGDGSNPATFIADMIPHVDFALVEAPYALNTISFFYPALYNASKALFVAENTDTSTANSGGMTSAQFIQKCPMANSNHTNTTQFNINYDGTYRLSCN